MITVEGEAEFAVMSAGTFQHLLTDSDELDLIRCVREGLQQARDGAGMPSKQYFASLRRRRKRCGTRSKLRVDDR